MNLPTSVLAELALLSEVLDSSAFDISVSLSVLVAVVTDSLPSFIGLTILVGDSETPVEITTVEDAEQAARIRTSLRFPVRGEGPVEHRSDFSGVLIIYAAIPGALVDLAADLAWLTGRPLSEAHLDEDLRGPASRSHAGTLARLSATNQAVGVLLGEGLTVEEALAELDARAAMTGTMRHLVAAELLASLSGIDSGAPRPHGPDEPPVGDRGGRE